MGTLAPCPYLFYTISLSFSYTVFSFLAVDRSVAGQKVSKFLKMYLQSANKRLGSPKIRGYRVNRLSEDNRRLARRNSYHLNSLVLSGNGVRCLAFEILSEPTFEIVVSMTGATII